MQKRCIAEERIEILDLYEGLDFPTTFAVLAHFSKDAIAVEYEKGIDVFVAQYGDRSYILGHNVLGVEATTGFEWGVLNDQGWAELQKRIATGGNRRASVRLN